MNIEKPDDWPSHLRRPQLRGLYVITDENLGGGHLHIARAALQGGARILQLRDKSAGSVQLLPLALELRRLTQAAGALFIINDRLDLAQAVRADGVHLGPDDWPLDVARRVLGPRFLLGASCGTVAEAQAAQQNGADYIGVGAVFSTSTKSDAGTPIGLNGLREISQATTLPVAAIGGVQAENIAATVQCGAAMACVVSAVASAGDNRGDENAMRAATRELCAQMRR